MPLHVSNERPTCILIKLFMKLTLIMAQMITYYQVPSLEVLADTFTCCCRESKRATASIYALNAQFFRANMLFRQKDE